MKKTFWAMILSTLMFLMLIPTAFAQETNGGILAALEALEANPAAYRLVIGLIVTLIINIFGYLENLARKRDLPYNKSKFAETLLTYEPLILLLPEAMPMKYAIVVAIIIDVWRRTYKAVKA